MLRLACSGHRRLVQSIPGSLNATFAGSESNVAAALARFGHAVRFITALPNSFVGEACLSSLRSEGIDVSRIVMREDARLGQFYVESGANQRPTRIQYDRAGSAVSLTRGEEYDWPAIMADAGWLHVSGITPAISRTAFRATRMALEAARQVGVRISMDVNFRSALWRWDNSLEPLELAAQSLRELLPMVDVLFTGIGDTELLGVRLPTERDDDADPLVAFCGDVVSAFPQVRYIAVSLREQQSASSNNYGCGLYDARTKTLLKAPLHDGEYRPWSIGQIIDRVGAGDAFAAGLLRGLSERWDDAPDNLQQVLEFATAAGCLAHSIEGDILYATVDEIDRMLAGDTTGRVQR